MSYPPHHGQQDSYEWGHDQPPPQRTLLSPLGIVLTVAAVACTAVVTIILMISPSSQMLSGTGSAGDTSVTAVDLPTQEQTEPAARAAAQQAFDLYSGGSYGEFWDRWSTESQALISRDDYLRLHEQCEQPAENLRFTINSVTVDGSTAKVNANRLIASFTFDFTYQDEAWRYVLPADQQKEYRTKGVDQIVRERKASNLCGQDALRLTPVPTQPSVTPTPAVPPAAAAKAGQPAQVGDLTFTVTRVEQGVQLKEPITNKPVRAQGQWVLVHVSVTSRASKPVPILGGRQALVDSQGRSYWQDSQAANYDLGDLALTIKAINPGQALTGAFVYDIPADTAPATLELHDYAQANSPAVKVTLR